MTANGLGNEDTLRCIIGNTLWHGIRNVCEIQDVTKWARIRKRAWTAGINRMDDNQLAKIAKTEKSNTPRPPGRLPKARREHCERTGPVDKIWFYKKEKKRKKEKK